MILKKSSSTIQNELRKAREHKSRYYLVAKGLSFTQYMKVKGFPLFNLGAYKGGIIVEQKTIREHPIGQIAERTIGYERKLTGYSDGKGIEWAFREFLNGKDGKILKQKIADLKENMYQDEKELNYIHRIHHKKEHSKKENKKTDEKATVAAEQVIVAEEPTTVATEQVIVAEEQPIIAEVIPVENDTLVAEDNREEQAG